MNYVLIVHNWLVSQYLLLHCWMIFISSFTVHQYMLILIVVLSRGLFRFQLASYWESFIPEAKLIA